MSVLGRFRAGLGLDARNIMSSTAFLSSSGLSAMFSSSRSLLSRSRSRCLSCSRCSRSRSVEGGGGRGLPLDGGWTCQNPSRKDALLSILVPRPRVWLEGVRRPGGPMGATRACSEGSRGSAAKLWARCLGGEMLFACCRGGSRGPGCPGWGRSGNRPLVAVGDVGDLADSSMNVRARAASTSCVVGRSRALLCDCERFLAPFFGRSGELGYGSAPKNGSDEILLDARRWPLLWPFRGWPLTTCPLACRPGVTPWPAGPRNGDNVGRFKYSSIPGRGRRGLGCGGSDPRCCNDAKLGKPPGKECDGACMPCGGRLWFT